MKPRDPLLPDMSYVSVIVYLHVKAALAHMKHAKYASSIMNLFLMGPSGVGKTASVYKALEKMFGQSVVGKTTAYFKQDSAHIGFLNLHGVTALETLILPAVTGRVFLNREEITALENMYKGCDHSDELFRISIQEHILKSGQLLLNEIVSKAIHIPNTKKQVDLLLLLINDFNKSDNWKVLKSIMDGQLGTVCLPKYIVIIGTGNPSCDLYDALPLDPTVRGTGTVLNIQNENTVHHTKNEYNKEYINTFSSLQPSLFKMNLPLEYGSLQNRGLEALSYLLKIVDDMTDFQEMDKVILRELLIAGRCNKSEMQDIISCLLEKTHLPKCNEETARTIAKNDDDKSPICSILEKGYREAKTIEDVEDILKFCLKIGPRLCSKQTMVCNHLKALIAKDKEGFVQKTIQNNQKNKVIAEFLSMYFSNTRAVFYEERVPTLFYKEDTKTENKDENTDSTN